MADRVKKIVITVLLAAVGILLVGYVAGVVYFSGHLLNGTTINGIQASRKTPDQVKKELDNYTLKLTEKGNGSEVIEHKISGSELSLSLDDESAINNLIKEQGMFTWFFNKKNEYQLDDMVSMDDAKLQAMVDSLQGFSSKNTEESQNATISQYQSGKKYEIVPEVIGNQLDRQKTMEKVKEAVLTLNPEIDLAKEDCYKQPAITSKDETLVKSLNAMNKYISAKITYKFGTEKEVLDADTIQTWLSEKNGKVKIDQEKVGEFVAGLRSRHDTIFSTRKFKSTPGPKVTIVGGDYGWWMNTNKEIADILKIVKAGKTVKNRTPEYLQTANSYGKNDYGNSYVEVNLTQQHVYVYKDGQKVYETDCVTGNTSLGRGTPEGVYSLTYKETDAELVGEGYSTPVKYWMPFNQNIGMHDATWRNSFGGQIYKTSGSHGCVNLPYEAAKTIYGYVEKGSPVICYTMPE